MLNRPEVVSDRTRRKVLDAIAALGFVRNESARQLRNGLSRTLAYVLLDPGNPYVLRPTQLAQRTPLKLIAQTNDAELYEVAPP